MLSVVLMTALTVGADAPSFFKHKAAWRYYGSYAGGCLGCYGCYYGNGCAGCYGGCYGAYAPISYGCFCYGCACSHGGYGCHGYYSCYGCYGCHCWSPSAPVVGLPTAPVIPSVAPEVEKAPMPEKAAPDKKAALPAPAKLIVELPADAKLYVDDQYIKSASDRREFNVPPLEQGQAYYYMVRVAVERDGQTVSQTKRIIVRAGEEVVANFKDVGVASLATSPLEGTGGR